MTRAALLGLSMFGAALMLALLIEVRGWALETSPLAQLASPPPPAHVDAPPASLSPAALLATILARPLFLPGRQPIDQNQPAPQATAATGLPRLAGVMIGPFGRSAIFAAPSAADTSIVVGIGARIGLYQVVEITVGEVRVHGPQGDQILSPGFDTMPSPDVTPTPLSAGNQPTAMPSNPVP
jgi:hypothetical protein